MEFQLHEAIQILQRTPAVLQSMLRGLPDEWIRSTEGDESWSAYDVIGHLIHGELTDWIPRMQVILGDSEQKEFIPFDRFAQFNDSQGKSIEELLDRLAQLRDINLSILRDTNPQADDLEKTGIHPAFGTVTLRQLLCTWVVHDLTHINQVSRVMAKQYKDEIGPWKAYINLLKEA